MTNMEYGDYVKKAAPKSTVGPNIAKAYLVGGLICALGQGLIQM